MKFGLYYNHGGKRKEYKKILAFRSRLFISMMIIGLVLLLLALIGITKDERSTSFLMGFGTGLFSISLIFLLKSEFVKRNAKRLKESERKEFDERNLEISSMAWRYTVTVLIFILCLLTVASAFIKPLYALIFASVLCFLNLSYVIFYHYFQRKF